MNLTDKQIAVLKSLAFRRNKAGHCSRTIDGVPWATPQDFGGSDGSHHSATATGLAKLGLVDRYKYTTRRLNDFNCRVKGACVYRITNAGLDELEHQPADLGARGGES